MVTPSSGTTTNGTGSKRRKPGGEHGAGAPLASLPLNVYSNNKLVQGGEGGNLSSIGVSTKSKPNVFSTRVSTTLKNIQPIRQQVKDGRYGKVGNSSGVKRSGHDKSQSQTEKSQIELRNCKENSRSRGTASFSRIPPASRNETQHHVRRPKIDDYPPT